MDIGKFRQVVRFDKNTPAASGAGFSDSYSELLTTRGYLKRRAGRRSLDFGEVDQQSSYELYVRHQSLLEQNLSISLKVVINSETYTVESWELVEEKKFYYRFIINKKG